MSLAQAGTDGQAVRPNVDHLGLLIDAVHEYAIFMIDPAGRVVTWNSGAHRIKGYAAEEILGQHFSVFYPPEDVTADKPQRSLEQAQQEGECRDEGWRVRKDGSRFWANVVITAVFGADGRLEGYAKVTRDDSERKQAEEHVRELELHVERERIAAQLHQTIVHQIFGAGLSLESSLQFISEPNAKVRILDAVDALDQAIKTIRAVALNLRANDAVRDRL